MENKEYLSIAQVAKILKISRTAVYKRVKKGDIGAIRIGKIFAIPKDYIQQKFKAVRGHPLKEEEKNKIKRVVKKTFAEYGEVLKRLGAE